jgi:hypothetical protein
MHGPRADAARNAQAQAVLRVIKSSDGSCQIQNPTHQKRQPNVRLFKDSEYKFRGDYRVIFPSVSTRFVDSAPALHLYGRD